MKNRSKNEKWFKGEKEEERKMEEKREAFIDEEGGKIR